MSSSEDEWLWGWDSTPGIVSVFAEGDGRVLVWRRLASDRLVREEERYRPWLLLASLEDLEHLGGRLRSASAGVSAGALTYEELSGEGALRFLVSADDWRTLTSAVLAGARRRTGKVLRSVHDLGEGAVLALTHEEQYLVSSGRTYFRGLDFGALNRVTFDLETTGLDARTDRIFLVAVRASDGQVQVLESTSNDDQGEAELIRQLVQTLERLDPDVIENHNLHGFDLPFLAERARQLGVPLSLARCGGPGLRLRAAATGRGVNRAAFEGEQGAGGASGDRDGSNGRGPRRMRYTLPGRELIDSLDAVRRHDFSARDLPSHGLKAVARKLGIASVDREYITGVSVYRVFREEPERVRRYARQDVMEAAALGALLGGAGFALAQMAPRRYERLADAGPATGIIDPLMVRAYLRARTALPAHAPGDGTPHTGAALHVFATGVAERIVKADVASLYPSLMRTYRIGPARDRLGVMLALVDRLVEQRLAAKRRARTLPAGSAERFTSEALSAAMKIVINSAYGYLGAVGLTRFADVHAANEVTRRGREVLALICEELYRRGVTLLEADTDGVYFSVPADFDEAEERRVVAEVAALLPAQVELEFEGRYAAMLSHEPKNYALKSYQGEVVLRGVAFRSRRAEPFGEAFLRRAVERLLSGDLVGVREAYVDVVQSLRQRALPTRDVTALARLTKSPEEYLALRDKRRELSYEALLASGRNEWAVGERVRVYRARGGRPALLPEAALSESQLGDDWQTAGADPRDYDVEYYVRSLRENFASRLERALDPEDFAVAFADPQQLSLFTGQLARARPVLVRRFEREAFPDLR
ncbi:MAG: DNA polymerase domain-containing protein [Myxococcota bacterium]